MHAVVFGPVLFDVRLIAIVGALWVCVSLFHVDHSPHGVLFGAIIFIQPNVVSHGDARS